MFAAKRKYSLSHSVSVPKAMILTSVLVVFAVCFQDLLLAASAYAAEGGHEEHAQFSDLFWPVVNFVLYVAILFFLLRKPLGKAWISRRDSIAGAVHTASEERREAKKLLAVQTEAYAKLEAKCSELSKTILEDANREAAQVRDDAAQRVEVITRQTKEGLVAEEHHAEVSVQHEISAKALDRALAMLKGEITPDVDRAIRSAVIPGIKQLAH